MNVVCFASHGNHIALHSACNSCNITPQSIKVFAFYCVLPDMKDDMYIYL